MKQTVTMISCNVCGREIKPPTYNMGNALSDDKDFDLCPDCYNIAEVLERSGLIRIVKKGRCCDVK